MNEETNNVSIREKATNGQVDSREAAISGIVTSVLNQMFDADQRGPQKAVLIRIGATRGYDAGLNAATAQRDEFNATKQEKA